MNMKRIISFIVSGLMMLTAFTACNNGTPSSGDTETTATPGEDGPKDNAYVYKRVVIIGVDGMGAFGKKAETPNMDRIFEKGAVTYTAQTAFPSISAQSWGSLLIGSSAYAHGLNNSIVESNPYENDKLPTIFKRVRDAMPDAVLASFCDWSPINVGIVEDNIGVVKENEADSILNESIVSYFAENDPTLFYAHFDSPDGAGHRGGYGSDTHLEQITTVDGYIGKVYDALAANGKLEDTLFIVTTDHGGTPDAPGNHGGTTEAEMNIFFGAVGKSVKEGSTIGEMNIRDTAAIVLHALGIDVPEFDINGFSAQIPEGIFNDYTVPERKPISAGENTFKTLPTPAKDSGKYITDVIDSEKISSVFHFNGNTDDAMGTASPAAQYTPKYYSTGYFDTCIEVGSQGSVSIPGAVPADSSFTVSLWFEHNISTSSDVVLLASHPYKESHNCGFSVVYNGSSITVCIGNGGTSQSFSYPMSEMIPQGWTNITVVFDKEESNVTGYINFENVGTENMSKRFSSVDFANSENVILGNDAQEYNDTNIMLDELVVFKSALTEDEVAKLQSYYQYEAK